MIVERTPEQQKKLDDIIAQIRKDFLKKLEKEDTTEKRTELLLAIQNAIDDFTAKEEAAAFKKLKGDRQAILDSAEEQIALTLERTKAVFLNLPEEEMKAFLSTGYITKKGKRYLINATYLIDAIKDEIRLHLKAFKNDAEALEKINSIILSVIYNDKSVNTEDLEKAARGLEINVVDTIDVKKTSARRAALDKLKNFWVMSAKTINTVTLNNYDLLEPTPDGQLTMKWLVDQSAENKKPVPTTVFLTNTDKDLLKELRGTKKNIKPFDRAVMDTIGSAFKTWEYSHPGEPLHLSPTALFRLMKGKQPGDKSCRVSDKQRQDLAASIRKLSATEFTIDIKAEVNAKYLNEDGLKLLEKSGKLKGFYLTDRLVDAIALGAFDENGRRTPMEYVFSRKPILCTYCEAKGQYLSIPFDVLDVFTDKSVTEYAIEVRNYLIIQIENMKNGKGYRRSNKILWETLYKSTGMKDPHRRVELREEGDEKGENKVVFANENSRQTAIRKERAKDKALVDNILKAWEQKGYIKAFKVDSMAIEIDPGKHS